MSALSAKRQAFVAEYLVDFNATQAALRAGYSPRGANVTGHRLLMNPNVMAELATGREKQAAQTQITQSDVLKMLEREATAGDFASPNTARIRAIELLAKIHGMLDRQSAGGTNRPAADHQRAVRKTRRNATGVKLMLHNFHEFETPIPPKVYGGPPPLEMREQDGDIYWRCECGVVGISSNREWAHSDVERHRRNGKCTVAA